MAGPVLDNLASTLLPEAVKAKTDKPKVKTGSVCESTHVLLFTYKCS